MRERIRRFFYLGFDKETIARLQAEINSYNIRALLTANVTLATVMLLCTAYVIFLLPDMIKAIMCIVMELMAVAGILVLKKSADYSERRRYWIMEVMTYWLMSLCFFCAAYMGSFGSEGNLAVSFVLILAIFPVFFIRIPYKNIVVILFFIVLFWIFSYHTKTESSFLYDVLHSTMGGISGVALSWSLSKTKVENMISKAQLVESNFALYHSSMTDSLTGLPNRLQIMEQLKMLAASQEHTYLNCLVLDIDDFKAYNDSYGHPQGDELLKKIGEVMKAYADLKGITVGRIGGEEFMAVWGADCIEDVDGIAAGMHRTVEQMRVPHMGARAADFVTASVGVFAAPIGHQVTHRAYPLADQALYHAKNNGRNCCWRYEWENQKFSAVGCDS